MSECPAKRARTDLTLDVKRQLIADFEKVPRPAQKDLAVKYSIGRATVSDILKRKDEFKQKFADNLNCSKKRFYTNSKFEDVNRMTREWFVRARSKNIPISGQIIKSKANVNIKFLPPNTTSILQPLDQGIIRAFKARYRHHMMTHLITRIDECNQ
ncbi:uncharacterized protein LOC126810200 [Patella vulgata]|uniref:uncharacterized protein LOC126810200 n=1 Tax=Patella vulgata TaxID=6465 RepID=UPI0024A98F51|nr:uncharacterized protein LOC126810200 [Patella vulgata]